MRFSHLHFSFKINHESSHLRQEFKITVKVSLIRQEPCIEQNNVDSETLQHPFTLSHIIVIPNHSLTSFQPPEFIRRFIYMSPHLLQNRTTFLCNFQHLICRVTQTTRIFYYVIKDKYQNPSFWIQPDKRSINLRWKSSYTNHTESHLVLKGKFQVKRKINKWLYSYSSTILPLSVLIIFWISSMNCTQINMYKV